MKYKVRLEFDVKSTDFLDVEVEAKSEEHALELAKYKYYENTTEMDFYASSHHGISMSDNTSSFLIEKCDDKLVSSDDK